ncbi:MAG TPA: hypothetical protein VKX17_05745 [Planctomycetota bacterium]|nr:hypothetical protein [Planctomycetota bacterium]
MSTSRSHHNRDRVIADTGWGIKPDDQPSNRGEAPAAKDVVAYNPAEPNVIRNLLRLQRRGFNTANRVRVQPGKTIILDINGDPFTIEGLSYGDPKLIDLLMDLGAAFSPQQMQETPADFTGTREFSLGKVWAWGAERSGG